MAESRWFQLYSAAPVWLQNAACTLAGVKMRRERYGGGFREHLAELERTERWSASQLLDLHQELLEGIVRHAYETVPYYREIMDARRLKPADVRTLADLPKLPILDKATVRRRWADLQSRGWPESRRVRGHTGGTTGTAMQLVSDVETARWQWAVWWRHRRRFGADMGQPFVVFAGRSVVPLDQVSGRVWRRNLAMRQTYVSVHHLHRQNLPAIADYLDTRRVDYYSGYPSALYLVARYLLDQGRRLRHPPRWTFTGAETVLPHQREVIERGLGTEIADQYGASEMCCNLSDCREHRYHQDMEFGAVELEPIPGAPSNVGAVIATGFRNPAMPLIRYRIGDVATRSEAPCPCGLHSPTFERIDGRIESYVITPDGRQLGRLDFLFKDTVEIEEAQIVQDRPDHVILKVVAGPGFGRADAAGLVAHFRSYAGDVIGVDVEVVPEIPREPNGKFRQIVSLLPPEQRIDGGLGSPRVSGRPA